MTANELKRKLQEWTDDDSPVIIVNNGYEWNGIKKLEKDNVVIKPKAVYIILGEATFDELNEINKHYETTFKRLN